MAGPRAAVALCVARAAHWAPHLPPSHYPLDAGLGGVLRDSGPWALAALGQGLRRRGEAVRWRGWPTGARRTAGLDVRATHVEKDGAHRRRTPAPHDGQLPRPA